MRVMLLLVVLSAFSLTSSGAEYIYRDLKGDTLPPPRCMDKEEARISVSKEAHLKRYGKRFCRIQGYGWGLQEVKNEGEIICEPCRKGKKGYQCRVKDVKVTCKRIKPGSVGLIPG